MNKAEAIYQAIQDAEVGSDIVIHNNDGSIWCILTLKTREHEED